MYVLIVFILSGNMQSVEKIGGFISKEECETAGKEAVKVWNRRDSEIRSSFVCSKEHEK